MDESDRIIRDLIGEVAELQRRIERLQEPHDKVQARGIATGALLTCLFAIPFLVI